MESRVEGAERIRVAGQHRSKTRVDRRRAPSPQPAFESPWHTLLAAAVLVAAAAATFVNALPNPFVFDDLHAITRNPNVTSLTPLSQALSAPVQSAISGRPLVSLSLALNYAWGGLAPSSYHLWNLAVHTACGLLVFAIVRRLLALASPDEH